jgi:hypothetical protein
MRVTACAMVLLACLLGVFMSKELSGNRQVLPAEEVSLDGFEWFDPTPPGSLGYAYLSLALTIPMDQGAK